jgi:hypothetical protein
MREAERRLAREIADLQARQTATEAVLAGVATLLVSEIAYPDAALAGLRTALKFTVRCQRADDAELLRLKVDEHIQYLVDCILNMLELK